MNKVYDVFIAGPMTGITDWNYPAFNAAAAKLREEGLLVFNPAELFGGDPTHDRSEYIREDISALLDSETVVMLPGWKRSVGASREHDIAVELGLEITYPEGDEPDEQQRVPGESVLQEAQRIIHGARRRDYGHPKQDWDKVASMWSVIFGAPVTSQQVGLAMICLKVVRHLFRPKRDNLVDISGYSGCVELVMEVEEGVTA